MVSSSLGYRLIVAAIGVFLGGAMAGPPVSAQTRQFRQFQIFNDGVEDSFIGIQMEDVTAGNMASYKLSAERGVIVRSVEKGSPAEASSLQVNDVILEYEGAQVWSSTQLARMVRETPPGRHVNLSLSRNGKRSNLTVIVGKRETQNSNDPRLRILPPGADQGAGQGPGDRVFEFRLPGKSDAFGAAGADARPNSPPRLGVTIQPLTDQLADYLSVPGRKGILVTSVMEGLPAYNKLKAGDVIIRANERAVESPEDLIQTVDKKRSGKMDLKVIRDKKEMTVEITLPEGVEKSRGGYRL